MNRHRERLFGDSSLKVYTITPADGEAEAGEFTCDWMGHRVRPTTSTYADQEGGAWQFQIMAASTWATTEAFMKKVVALTIGSRRWKVTKIEEPIGESLVWKLRAETER